MRSVRALILISLTLPVYGQENFTAFKQAIPDTDLTIAMVPVTGGSFTMGSPEGEPGRDASEGLQHKVTVADF
jgi:formylglycine-generating enzyme required for sulfatase activity